MTADEVWGRATRAVSALRAALEAKVAELEASGVAEEAWLASELVGWLSVLEPPRLGDIDAAVLAQACAPTDPELALLSFPAWARPVTTPPMPPLPQPPPPAAVPGHVRSWRDAFSKEAYDAMLKWFRDVRRAINQFMRGVEGEALWRLVPRSMAFGIEHFQPWLAQLAAAGHVVARVKEGFEVVDTSRAPPTKLNRPYLAELFAETGCADLLLRDAVLTHGFVYFADMAPQVVLQKPLRSFFTGVEQLLSLHSETLRMSESGWFELICMPELDAGVIELPCCPCRLDPSGLVGRQLEARVRGIKNCGAPHKLLLCMAPPSPPLHEHSGGGRVPVISTNAATGMRSGKGVVREARAQAAGGKLPPAAQRHTPGLRRAAEAFGERDTLEIGRAPAPSSASGAARRETKSWAGGRWLWPQELKPFFIDLMLAACILGHGAELCGADLYVAGDDIKDMFHAFPLAALQCWSMGLLRLDPHALTAESLDAALCVVQARCLEMGVAPSSNWAQRFLTEINLGFSKRFARANEPLLLALDEAHPPFAAWRAARRELSARTGRDEALGHWVSGYTDDIVALVIGVDSMVLFLCMHAEHFGPRGVNMRMAVAAKRSLGVSAKFIGGKLLTTGSLVYVEPEKVLRTDGALQDAIAGQLTLADWTKLVGLLNHLVCILLMPYYIMYDVYDISDACRDARLGPDDTIVTTPKGVKALRRWLAQLRSTAGTTALSAAFALRRAGVGGTVHALRSDAAILGTGKPAICGALYGAVYVLALTPQWLEMPIVVLEYLGGLLNLIIFGPRLRGAPCALLLDALVVPTVMAGKASAPMMRFLQLRFVALVRDLELNLQVGHEYGPFNPICDAGSRGKMREMEAIINNLNLTLEHVDVPAAGLELMAETHAEWSRLAETERAAARAADAEVAALRRQHGVRAVMAHPDAGGCAPEALGLGRSPACNAYDGPGSEAEHFAPAGLESGLAAAADAPRVRVGRTANGPTAAAAVGVAVEVVALPLTRSAASDTSDGYAHWPPAGAATIGVKKEPAGCTTIGVAADVCGPRVQRATNGGKGGPGVCPRRCVPRACLVVFAALASAIEGAVFGAPSAARAMGAPLLVAAAAGVRVTGLDLLQQRALGAQAGSVRDGAALPAPTSSGLPAGYQVVVDAQAPAAQGPRYATGLDILRARTGAAAPLGSRAPDPIGSSWAARGGSPFFLGTDPTSAAAARRRAAGLSVMPEGGARREAMTERLSEALEHGYAPRTRAADQGHWRRWERFCKSIGTSPWRTDMAANSGMDAEGHQEEVFLMASAMLHAYENMYPRRRSDPAADPRSAQKYIEAVRRTHRVKGITMASMEIVRLAVKGLCREYIDEHDVHTLVPERKLSFTDAIVADMFRCPDGATRGALTLDWSSYYWIAVDACFQTLAEEGSRKDEVSKPTAATPFRRGRFTFASLVWFVDGRELRRAPTREELLTLKPGDGVLLKHGISKNDPFGSYFAATPSFLAYREGTDRCACRALARLELAAGLAGAARGRTPLFGPEPGVEFTHHQLDQALKLLLTRGAGVAEAELENYSVHSFRIFVACALLAAGAPRWLIKRMLRWRGDESLEVYARVNNTEWASWTGKIVNVAVQSTISSRLNYMDFSEETTAHFNAVAQSMLTLGIGRQRNTPETF